MTTQSNIMRDSGNLNSSLDAAILLFLKLYNSQIHWLCLQELLAGQGIKCIANCINGICTCIAILTAQRVSDSLVRKSFCFG